MCLQSAGKGEFLVDSLYEIGPRGRPNDALVMSETVLITAPTQFGISASIALCIK